MGDEDRQRRLGFGSVHHSCMDYSAQIKCRNFVAVLVFFYSSIVSHSMSEKMLLVAYGKHDK